VKNMRTTLVKGTPAQQPSAAPALLLAGLCIAGLVVTWVVAALLPVTHLQDAVALNDFARLSRPRADVLANALLGLLDPLLFTVWSAVLIAIALVRARPRVALAVACVLPMAPLTSETLKPLLAHPHAQVGLSEITAASWPSGHSTAAMALVLCAVLVAPRSLRPLVAMLGVLFAAAVGFSLLMLAWHLPSDVFGGYLVAIAWTMLAVAALRASERRWPSARRRPRELGGGIGNAVRAGVP
jgi:membrane-associated phospholipid phosphatase